MNDKFIGILTDGDGNLSGFIRVNPNSTNTGQLWTITSSRSNALKIPLDKIGCDELIHYHKTHNLNLLWNLEIQKL